MRTTLQRLMLLLACALACRASADSETNSTPPAASLILVVGAPGESEFASNFLFQVELWTNAARAGNAKLTTIGQASDTTQTDYDQLKRQIELEDKNGAVPLWVVFIGHGTFDGKEARFNLRGPDVTASECAEWLKPFTRPLVFIDTTSASAPFLNKLSRTNRVIVTATRAGTEQNFARFGRFFAEALTRPESDLDKDGQVSVLEAFLNASARVAEFYKSEGRLATEHALLDDNGDGLGTPPDWFRSLRPAKKPEGGAGVDGTRAHQFCLISSKEEQLLEPDLRARRDALELQISQLRESKSNLPEAEYYSRLESLLNQLVAAYGDKL